MTKDGGKGWRVLAVFGAVLILVGLVKVLGPDTYVQERLCGPAISVVVRGPVTTGATPPAEWVQQCRSDAWQTVGVWLGVLLGGLAALLAGLRLRPTA